MKGMGKSLQRGEMILVPFYCDVIIGQPQYFSGTKEEIVKQVEEAVINLRKKFDWLLFNYKFKQPFSNKYMV